MRALPTFSALPRAFACAASACLPVVEEHSEAASAGTARHRFLRRVADLLRAGTKLEDARHLALADAPPDQRPELALVPAETLGRLKEVVAEQAFAIDPETGGARVLGRALDRRYDEAGRKPNEIAGAVDAFVLFGAEGALVRDWKGRSHARKPDEDEQLLAGAYAVARVHGRRWVDVEVIRLINGRPFPRKERVALPDLERFGQRLRALAKQIHATRTAYEAGTLPPMASGVWCRYCPSLRFCPAKGSLAQVALGANLPEVLRKARAREPYITPENAPRLRERVAELEGVVKLLKGDLQDFARQTPFRQRDGRVYGPTSAGRVIAHRAPQDAGGRWRPR